MTNKEIRAILQDHFGTETGAVSLHKGIWTVREGYFYRHGRSAETLVKKVQGIFPQAHIIDQGDHWANFNGGASLKASSHFWVQFKIGE